MARDRCQTGTEKLTWVNKPSPVGIVAPVSEKARIVVGDVLTIKPAGAVAFVIVTPGNSN